MMYRQNQKGSTANRKITHGWQLNMIDKQQWKKSATPHHRPSVHPHSAN